MKQDFIICICESFGILKSINNIINKTDDDGAKERTLLSMAYTPNRSCFVRLLIQWKFA